MSIARLELQAAVLGVRLSKVVTEGHEFKISSVHYWSDSQTVISWIYSTERRFKAFVSHRVAEILENSLPTQWKWIPTNLNAADAGTRPTYPPKFIQNSLWITGPAFLYEEESCWPNNEVECPDLLQDEVKPCLFATNNNNTVIQFSRFSSYTKLKRCVAWVLRFLKSIHSTDDLRVDEITSADIIICRLVQSECYQNELKYLQKLQAVPKSSTIHSLVPYLDGNSLLRVNGHLVEALFLPLNARRPIILPQKHYVSELIMMHYHIKNHHQNMSVTINELRQRYWIPHIKSVFKKVVKKCYVCKYDNAKPTQPLMGTLPPDRVTPFIRPFTYTGVDLFGPFNVAIGRRKEKRGGHIELAENLSADAFILCFRNFVNRRGTPVRIRSDNGTNFIASQKLLKKEVRLLNIDEITKEATKHNIEWIFNCPANPSSGGCWERLIRIVKRLLLKTLRDSTPRLETLRSVLIEAENIINSRPLTEIPVSSEDAESITPNHFLIGCLNTMQTPITNEENICLRKQWRIAQNLKDRLWKRWVTEFLPQLMQRPKWKNAVSPIQIDDIVLILDSSQPRHQWLKGRVLKTYPSKDGQVRFADIKTKNGVTRRPASKLAVLNLSSGEPVHEGGNVRVRLLKTFLLNKDTNTYVYIKV
ncbi:uncharacterized protein LOC135958645 [Calliphora vicina]|uniref:uncharacterized protein LOC135958645 n=1 Tax=Calliphora vicina TaxID=7373 RepID=UPI00325A792B